MSKQNLFFRMSATKIHANKEYTKHKTKPYLVVAVVVCLFIFFFRVRF